LAVLFCISSENFNLLCSGEEWIFGKEFISRQIYIIVEFLSDF